MNSADENSDFFHLSRRFLAGGFEIRYLDLSTVVVK